VIEKDEVANSEYLYSIRLPMRTGDEICFLTFLHIWKLMSTRWLLYRRVVYLSEVREGRSSRK
jgi:hypothetical protein